MMREKSKITDKGARRIRFLSFFFLLVAAVIMVRLFILQIIQHDYYALFALNTHEISKKLHPIRGKIYFQDTRNREEFPAAINREYFLVYAAPREIAPIDVVSTTDRLAEIFGFSDEAKLAWLQKLSSRTSAYAPLDKKASQETVEKIKAAKIPGIYYVSQLYRYYPEESMGANVLGFVGSNEAGALAGRYGVEGYWEKKLAGKGGLVAGEQGALGSWITLGGRTIIEPENGPDLLLTIDRTLQYKACERLKLGLKEYKAKSAALVMMNPETGAIIALCSLPDFDPNNYSKVDNLSAFNNTAIFTPYEPGSVFKPVTMAAGLDLNIITPNSTYVDPCQRVINGHIVRNAQQKCYGRSTMTEVLENSINTGVVWVQEQIGNKRFSEYVKKFGFGEKTGIALDTEAAGDISSLNKAGQIFGANGSFGQGLTATPLQLAGAYAAIANGGRLPRPYIVEEVRYQSGRKDKTELKTVEQAVAPRAAKLLSGMLVSVVENHYTAARLKGYYVAGKTGTAQIPERGGYSATRTNHTFAGFAPAGRPKVVLVVKYEEPERQWAEQTALPVFKDVMQFALAYYGVSPERQ